MLMVLIKLRGERVERAGLCGDEEKIEVLQDEGTEG